MNITTIKKDDILFGRIDIGNLPSSRAGAYLEKVKLSFKILRKE